MVTTVSNRGTSYKDAGVDIDEADRAVSAIRKMARATFTKGVLTDIGSFGGCFALLGVMAIACLLAIIFLCTASKHKAAHHTPAGTIQQELPNADILPPTLGNLGRGQETMIAETGTPAQLLHCVYGTDIQVYAIPEKGITDKRLATFREIVRAVCVQTNPPLSNEEVHGKMAYYDIIGANGGLVGDTAERLNNLVGR